MKHRTIIGIVCVIAALAIAFGLAPMVNKFADNRTDVIRVKRDIPQGHKLTEEDIGTVTVGSFNLPAEIISDMDAAVGKFASCDMKTGDFLFPAKLADSADSASDVFRSLDGTQTAISVTIPSFAGGLSGKLQNGDIVSMIVYRNDDGEETSFIPDELKYVRVITSTTAEGIDKDELTQNEDGTYELPSTLTLLVTPAQAMLLTQYENDAKLHAALVCRDNAELAERFLSEQQAVLAEPEEQNKSDADTEMKAKETENG